MGDSSSSSDPASGDQVRGRWRESGVPDTVVNDAITYVRNTGGVLSGAALHLGVLHLLRETGNGSDWMEGTSWRQCLGTRQGCKFGAIIFNLMYCHGSDDLRRALKNEGLLSEFAYYPEAAPWCHVACKSDGAELEESSYEMCDVTYVDDECVCCRSGIERRAVGEAPENL